MQQFFKRLKFVRFRDFLSLILFIVAIPIALIVKPFIKDLWLVCERKNEARDNGYWFFKYVRENYPQQNIIYAINKKSVDYEKVKKLGQVINFGSLIHWIYYICASKNISSQKEGKPNAAVCFVLEVYLNLFRNRVYIRHGIVKDKQRWVYYDVSKITLFICSAQREYDFVVNNFGYKKENVCLVGLCRFDNLFQKEETKKQILIMPTWREWLGRYSIDTLKNESSFEFSKSDFYIHWNSLLSNKVLNELLVENKLNLVFYLHSGMQKYIDYFNSISTNISIASDKEYDVQDLLISSQILITDYSSVYFDFAYMEKPLLYYQFDYEKYRIGQYQEGYFSYENDGFGKVCISEDELISNLEKTIENNMKMESLYKDRVKSFFAFNDNENCKRTYQVIKKM